MVVASPVPVADALSGAGRLQVIAVLLGILVFGILVLLVERRNSSHEAAPPGLTGAMTPSAPPRQVYRAPANAVPVASARDAATLAAADAPYPVPFIDPVATPPDAPGAGGGTG